LAFGPYRNEAAKRLSSIVAQSRQDLGLPGLRWFVSQNPPDDGNNPKAGRSQRSIGQTGSRRSKFRSPEDRQSSRTRIEARDHDGWHRRSGRGDGRRLPETEVDRRGPRRFVRPPAIFIREPPRRVSCRHVSSSAGSGRKQAALDRSVLRFIPKPLCARGQTPFPHSADGTDAEPPYPDAASVLETVPRYRRCTSLWEVQPASQPPGCSLLLSTDLIRDQAGASMTLLASLLSRRSTSAA
jgi:hypothetical protein